MLEDAYNTIQDLIKNSSGVIRSIEFYTDGSFMCRTSLTEKELKEVAFENMNQLLEFLDEHPF